MAINQSIDYNIPGSVRGFQGFGDIGTHIGNALTISDMLDTRKQAKAEKARALAEEEAVAKIFPKYMGTDGEIDEVGLYNEAKNLVRPHRMFELQKEVSDYKKDRLEQIKKQQESLRQSQGYESLNKMNEMMTPTQSNISALPVDQVTKDQAIQAATGTGTVTLPGAPLDEALQKSGAIKYMDNPAVKEYTDYLVANKKIDKSGAGKSGTPYNRVGARALFDNPENRDKTKQFIVDNKEKLGIDDAWASELSRQIDQGWVYDVNETLQRIAEKQMAIQPEVNKQFALVAPKAAQAEASGKASEQGKAEGETAANVNAIPGFKPIQGFKITNESVKKVKDAAPLINTMNSIVDNILGDIKTKGYKYTGDDAATFNANVRYLQMLAKSEPVFNLGVIAGPDLMLLDQIIADPSSLKQGMKSVLLGSIEKRLGVFKKNLNTGATEKYKANGFEKEPDSKSSAKTSSGNRFTWE